MKKVRLFLVATFINVSVFAAGNGDVGSVVDPTICPKGSELIHVCKSTPEKGDGEVAAGMLDAITVCQRGQSAVIAVMKSGQVKKGKVDQVDIRVGGISYLLVLNQSIKISLSIPVGILSKESKAQFSMNMPANNLTAKSTYTCERQ